MIAYGDDYAEEFRQAAGASSKAPRPADLPVQNPKRFELVINLKTAKALGLTIPESGGRRDFVKPLLGGLHR